MLSTALWSIGWTIGLGALAYHRLSLKVSTALIATSLIFTTFLSPFYGLFILLAWAIFAGATYCFLQPEVRQRIITRPFMRRIAGTMPTISDTESQALEAGDTWWEAQWFKGTPDWAALWDIPPTKLTEEEEAFLAGPVEQACRLADDWDITQYRHDLSPELWGFLKKEGFFSLIIPKAYGGKEFSAAAHSAVVTKLSSKSITLSTTVAVPNTLGPAELLLHYGTEEQKSYYLPRLATGEEMPCFALTGPEAGSDASAIPDRGVVCRGTFEGKEIVGIRLNWDKRYITLAPIATVLGLAFRLFDPEHLIGKTEDIGITCVLIPTNTPGVVIGRRHLPVTIPFQNGPTQGKDVFIPLDWIIGGQMQAGQGWLMLMESLSAGRAITLPSSSAGAAKAAIQSTGAYARIRKQFKSPICVFEGIQTVLARLAGYTYLSESLRLLTIAGVDTGKKPVVASAISKYHTTELGRIMAEDTMDIHGGKGIMMGPRNYVARGHQSTPISITVEGANILTRNLIIFGQGVTRCHPYLQQEIAAVHSDDLEAFDSLFCQHAGHSLSNATRACFHALTHARFAEHPTGSTSMKLHYQQLTQAGCAFAIISDIMTLLLGGKLKFKENLSARLGDLLSYLYMGSAALKLFKDQGEPVEDEPLVHWAAQYALGKFWLTFQDTLDNFPNRWVARALRLTCMPLGRSVSLPNDRLSAKVAATISTTSGTRHRLMSGMYDWQSSGSHAYDLEQALLDVLAAEPIEKKIYQAAKDDILGEGTLEELLMAAQKANVITPEEADMVAKALASRRYIIAVDDFPADGLALQSVNANPNRTSQTFVS